MAEAETGARLPQAKENQSLLATQKLGVFSSLRLQREHRPAYTLILDF